MAAVTAADPPSPSSWINPVYFGSLLLLIVALGVLFQLRDSLPDVADTDAAVQRQSDNRVDTRTDSPREALPALLLALIVVIAVCRLVGWVFQLLHQPPVIGEVMAGILLGPSLLGTVWPAGYAALFPTQVVYGTITISLLPLLGVIAELGIILYMFLIGLEFDAATVREHGKVALFTSHLGLIVPFLTGVLLAGGLFSAGYAPAGVGYSPFAMFLGISLAITAFPVLARILQERSLTSTALGRLALSAAAIGDVTAWCALAFVVGFVQAEWGPVLRIVGFTVGFLVLMLLVVRPLLLRVLRDDDQRSSVTEEQSNGEFRHAIPVLLGMLLAAWIAEWIGIHAIFGAFLWGTLIPHDCRAGRWCERHLTVLTRLVLLPAFFALTGIKTQIGLVSGAADWIWCAVIIAVAVLGKVVGSYLAARLSGYSPRFAVSLGVLMNTRGLMELIVLNIGLELGVITPRMFAMMVLMALATTLMTAPLLSILQRERGTATA